MTDKAKKPTVQEEAVQHRMSTLKHLDERLNSAQKADGTCHLVGQYTKDMCSLC